MPEPARPVDEPEQTEDEAGRAVDKPTVIRDAQEGEMLLHLPPDRAPSPILRPWRIGAGVAFGAAVATKWSGAPALLGAILLAFMWERGRRSRTGSIHPIWESVRVESFGIFVFLILLPVAIYVASYARWWADTGLRLVDFWHVQTGMATYSIHLRASHPYQSSTWSWLLLKRPVAYYYKGNSAGTTSAEILGIGNPLIFWGSVIAFLYLLAVWVTRKDWRAGFIFLAFVSQYSPWFFASRTAFLFYMAPMTPFMVLAMTYLLKDLTEMEIGVERSRALAPIAALVVVVAVGLFLFFLPVLTGRTISHTAWNARMWFRDCSPKANWCWI
jgi:dolichyl-phosphate-mannose--protein O-mannosyl transferase